MGFRIAYPDVSPDAMGKGYPAMVDEYKQMFGEAPISGYHANSYDAATMAVMAIKKVAVMAKDGTIYIGRKALRDAVFATKFEGVGGPIGCDAYGECAQFKPAVYEFTNADAVHLQDRRQPEAHLSMTACAAPASFCCHCEDRLRLPGNDCTSRAALHLPGRQGASMSAVVHARRVTFHPIARMNFVDIALWAMRILVLAVVIGGTVGTLIRSRYGITEWLDFLLFGVTHRQHLCPGRAGLHHGVRRAAADQLRARRHHDDRRLRRLFRRHRRRPFRPARRPTRSWRSC